MATAPMKSQPLHNFSLPHLKWAHKSPSSASSSPFHHRFRRRDSPDNHAPAVAPPPPCEKHQQPQAEGPEVADEDSNGEVKPWKLRPRKEVKPPPYKKETAAEQKNGSSSSGANGRPQRSRAVVEVGPSMGSGLGFGFGVDRKEKRKIWISLSREEIEEDVYALTGSRPARRPKKRPKNVQKDIDSVFPGLYLVGVTVDSYRHHDSLGWI